MQIKIAISVVDDDKDFTTLIKDVLVKFDIHSKIEIYNDFDIFVEELGEDVDLIFLDIDMPSCYNLEQKIKTIDTLAGQAYTIILSSSMNPLEIIEAISYGANGYIIKGVRQEEFLESYCRNISRKINIRHNILKKYV